MVYTLVVNPSPSKIKQHVTHKKKAAKEPSLYGLRCLWA